MATVTMEVKGLREANANLHQLKDDVQGEIARHALWQGAWTIGDPVRAATYTTFLRRTGFIKSGYAVRVGRDLKGTVLNAVVVQKPQSIAGSAPAAKLFRSSVLRASKRSKKVELSQIAFYWRFLELGTRDRRSARTPKSQTPPRLGDRGAERKQRALEKFLASHSTGRITPRPWVRPAFGNSAAQSVQVFADTMRSAVDDKVSSYPK